MTSDYILQQTGLTLLETLIAMLIFSVGILGVGSMQVVSMLQSSKSRSVSFDSVAAADALEAVLGLPYDDPMLADPDDGFSPDSPDHGPFTLPVTRSRIEWEVDDQLPIANTKRIRITIWDSHPVGRSKVLTYEYIKSKGLV